MAGLQDITRDVGHRFKIRQKDARALVEYITNDITARLGKGETVNVRGFGVFKVKEIGERKIKSPQTHEEITVPPTVRICFTATKLMKNKIKVGKGLMSLADAGLTEDDLDPDKIVSADDDEAGDEE